jgi:YegS/Rv2252/BmrU family lipid kinase
MFFGAGALTCAQPGGIVTFSDVVVEPSSPPHAASVSAAASRAPAALIRGRSIAGQRSDRESPARRSAEGPGYAHTINGTAPHLLLVNPSSAGGRTRELLPAAERALQQKGIGYRLVFTTGLEHGCEEAQAAAEEGEVVVVMSGDGLVGQVGGALAGSGASMGIIPGGRGNDLARVLGIPAEPDAAAALIAAGHTREIDVGEVNGTRFLGIASCGFDSDANRIANETRRIKGNLVYAYAALRALIAWKPATFTLLVDGERKVVTGYSVAAANSKAYGGGMYAFPDAELDDGLLDVGATGNVGKIRFVRGLAKIFSGEHQELLEAQIWRAAEVEIDADRPFAVYADGDHIADLPATVRLLPRALRVIVPRLP